jgi:hypothetical protein
MSQDHSYLNHAAWECKYHVVFTPKYRKKVRLGKSGGTWALCSTSSPGSRKEADTPLGYFVSSVGGMMR